MRSVEAGPTLRFAAIARRLGDAARAAGLVAPAFRSPPAVADRERSIRRFPGGAVVAVRTHDRPFDRVVVDMVEGVVAANELDADDGIELRAVLWGAVAGGVHGADGPDWSPARVAERQTQAA